MESDPSKKRGSARPTQPALIVCIHWFLAIAFFVSLLTGFRIAADYLDGIVGSVARRIIWLLPRGQVIDWHVMSSWAVVLLTLAYAFFLWRGKLYHRVRLSAVSLKSIRPTALLARTTSAMASWHALNRVVFHCSYVLLAIMAITGWMMYRESFFGFRAITVQSVHGLGALALIVVVIVHPLVTLKIGRFFSMFRPRGGYRLASLISIFAAAALIAPLYFVDASYQSRLIIPRVAQAPVLDGRGHDPLWSATRAVSVRTVRGANLPGGQVDVEVRAVHDGEQAYFQFRWADDTRSQKHHPLVKTEQGWRVMATGYETNDETNDENVFYEDKFAAILSLRPSLGTGSVHLGEDLIPGPHYRNSRGLHFTTDGSILDLWHWKSIRSGVLGYADDNFIGPPMASERAGARYTGGYTQDPSPLPGHPYLLNWVAADRSLPLHETTVLPRFLPRDQQRFLQHMENVGLDPSVNDEGIWHLLADEAIAYDELLDDYPVGTILPGVILTGEFQGDRANVRAAAHWENGQWTLQLWRTLDTGTEFDIALSPDRPTFLWVAVFNHSQIRHSQHLHPIKLILQ